MQEIERKFLIDISSVDLKTLKSYKITQKYLSFSPTVRVRIQDNQAFLTIKGPGMVSKLEIEYSIDLMDAKKLFKLSSYEVTKTRYLYPHKGHIWEIDVFAGRNKGLVVAEIELKSVKEKFTKPSFVLKEVSQDSKYSNANLAKKPYSQW